MNPATQEALQASTQAAILAAALDELLMKGLTRVAGGVYGSQFSMRAAALMRDAGTGRFHAGWQNDAKHCIEQAIGKRYLEHLLAGVQ